MNKIKRQRKSAARAEHVAVLRITNPFNPREHVKETLAWRANQNLRGYFPLGGAEHVVSINGRIVPQDQFESTYLQRGDNLVICPVPAGNDGKQILAIVAMIVITVYAGPLAGAMGFADAAATAAAGSLVLTTAGQFAAAGIIAAGSLLVHAIFAPSMPTRDNGSTAATYGIDGAKNTSTESICVPVCYGQFRMAGNVLDVFVENSGDTQILYMLLNAGEGPVASISQVNINGNPLSDYPTGVEVQTRLGHDLQTAMPWFNNIVVPQNLSHKLTESWFHFTTVASVDKLRFDITAPQGLVSVDTKSGALNTYSVTIELQYRRVSGGPGATWSDVASQDIEAVSPAAKSGEIWLDDHGFQINDPAIIEYLDNGAPDVAGTTTMPVYTTTLTLSSNARAALRKSFTTGILVSDRYETRMRRVTPKSKADNVSDEVFIADVNEIQAQTLSYPSTALLALKITLGDQITGLPQVTFINGGRLVDVYGVPPSGGAAAWHSAPSNNPAWVVWDILTHRRYGGAMPAARLDFAAFKDFAAFCDAQNLSWNGPIDGTTNVWDASQLVLRLGHAQIVNVGTRYSVVIERVADPVMMFSVANMVQGTYKETWLSTTDRANEIDVTFFDKLDDNKQRAVKVYDPAVLANGVAQRTSAITLYGVVDEATAYKEGQFQLNLNRFVLKTVEFSAPMEAIACTVGDLILIQSDMTDWAVAGRFDAASTASVARLDRDVTMEAGKSYKLLVLHDKIERASGVVTSVIGTSIILSGFDGASAVKRVAFGAKDMRVAGVFNAGGSWGVLVDDAAGIVNGAQYVLWDTDVIAEYGVVNVPGTTSVVTTTTPMALKPAQFVNWMFGQSERVKQSFRIRRMNADASSSYNRNITAIQYDSAVYEYNRFTNAPVIDPKLGAIGPASDLELYEETYISGNTIVSRVVAHWRAPGVGNYAGADIYVGRGKNVVPTLQESVLSSNGAVIVAGRGDIISVRVVAFDLFGKRSAFLLAPQVSNYAVIGELAKIDVGAVSGAAFLWSGRNCKISWRYNATTHAYDFGSEPTGADGGALDPQFKDYEVRVYDGSGKLLRRTEHVPTNSYVYIYDKNFADGLTRHLTFEIRMRDIFNNLGKPAILTAKNAAPSIANVSFVTDFSSITLSYTHSDDPDFAGARIWLSRSNTLLADPFDPLDTASLAYEGPDTSVLLSGLMFDADYYVRVAAFDAFGMTELVPTGVIRCRTSFLNVAAIADGVLRQSKLDAILQERIGLIAINGASIVTETENRVTAVGAVAKTVTTLTTTVNENTANIQTNLTSLNGLKAQYTLKVDLNGYLAGFGLAAYTRDDGSHTSEFLVRADTFAIVMPSYPGVHPFTVGAVGGIPRVIISNALIGDASIKTAMIGHAEINTLNVAGSSIIANVYANGATSNMAENSSFSAASGVITMPSSNSGVIVIANISCSSGSNTGIYFHIERDGVQVGNTCGSSLQGGYAQNVSFAINDAPGAGTFLYQLVCVNSASGAAGAAPVSIGTNNILILGAKR